jgi:hypothetical protein
MSRKIKTIIVNGVTLPSLPPMRARLPLDPGRWKQATKLETRKHDAAWVGRCGKCGQVKAATLLVPPVKPGDGWKCKNGC